MIGFCYNKMNHYSIRGVAYDWLKSYLRVSHNRLPGCPRQPFLPVGQPKVDPWLPDRATESFAICIYIYVVGQPNCLVRQPQLDTGCPIGQPVFKTNVKPCTLRIGNNLYKLTILARVFLTLFVAYLRTLF